VPESPRIEQLQRRVQADPASIAFAALAEEYRKEGRYLEAIDTCRVGLQRHPAYLSARVTLGRALIGIGDFEGARSELEAVLRAAPENLAAIRAMAEIHGRVGEAEETPETAPDCGDGEATVESAEPPPPPSTFQRASPLRVVSFEHPAAPSNAAAIERLEHFLGAITGAREAAAQHSGDCASDPPSTDTDRSNG
jgi:tetratricopeptide (TPR) repeat protein